MYLKRFSKFNVTSIHFSRISAVTHDLREVSYLFQRVSVAIQRFNGVCFRAVACWEKNKKGAVGAKFHFGAPCDRKRRKGGGVWGGDSAPLPKLENFAKREV